MQRPTMIILGLTVLIYLISAFVMILTAMNSLPKSNPQRQTILVSAVAMIIMTIISIFLAFMSFIPGISYPLLILNGMSFIIAFGLNVNAISNLEDSYSSQKFVLMSSAVTMMVTPLVVILYLMYTMGKVAVEIGTNLAKLAIA